MFFPNRSGKTLILIDPGEASGKGRGLMFSPAFDVTAETVNLMARFARGVISAGLGTDRAIQLGLTPMPRTSSRRGMPHYLASVEAVACKETGISAAERAMTLRCLADPQSSPADLHSPGHVMPCIIPLSADTDPLLRRAHEIAQSLGPTDVFVWSDILDETGERASADYCRTLARDLDLNVLDIRHPHSLHIEECLTAVA